MSFASLIQSYPSLIGRDQVTDTYPVRMFLPSTAHQDGNWVEVMSSAPCDLSGFRLVLHFWSNTSGDRRWWVDVGIGGAGQERLAVRGLGGNYVQYSTPVSGATIPLRIKRGQRVSLRARQSASVSNADIYASIHFTPASPAMHTGFNNCTTLGADLTTTNGLLVPQAYGGGTITEFSPGIPHPIRAMSISHYGVDTNGNGSNTILLGPSGQERVLSRKIIHSNGFGTRGASQIQGPMFCDIPPNTRISVQRFHNNATYPSHFILHAWY